MPAPSPALDEFQQAELDARRFARAEGYALGEPPAAEVLAHLPVIE